MPLKQFLQNLLERVGLAEAPLPPPRAADMTLAEPQQLRPILLRLAAWNVKRVTFVADGAVDADETVEVVRQAKELGIEAGLRGRASDLVHGNLLAELAAAGASEVELPLLSATAEVHDALAGMGDYRAALKALDALAAKRLSAAVQLPLVPATTKTLARTLEMLDDRRVRVIRPWAIVCRDDEPTSWALAANDLVSVSAAIEKAAPREVQFAWYPPLRFDPAHSLAQQVRRGPRAARDAVRIEPDGAIFLPIGPATASGNVSQNEWKSIARGEAFRAWKRRREAAARCEGCPVLDACNGGCFRDVGNWAED